MMAKGISTEELDAMTDAELLEKLKESKEELFNLRFQNAVGQLKNTSRIRDVRKTIARVLTIAGEKRQAMASDAARR